VKWVTEEIRKIIPISTKYAKGKGFTTREKFLEWMAGRREEEPKGISTTRGR